jgi:hypothetical protein
MASAWNYSSFMPSATTQKISKDQYATGSAPVCRRPVPLAKFAACSIFVRRTTVVQQLKQKAASSAKAGAAKALSD